MGGSESGVGATASIVLFGKMVVVTEAHSARCGMDKYPAKQAGNELPPLELEETGVQAPGRSNPFFSFRYSYREVSLSGGKTHIKSRDDRFEDGKFRSEEFEGSMEEDAYHEAVRQSQDFVKNQAGSLLRLFSTFLPLPLKSRDR